MTTDQLKSIFEKDYNREEWRNALYEIFHIKTLFAIPSPVNLGVNDFDAKAVELGNFETSEGLKVGLYEVSISPEKLLDRNKVGLRNLMRRVYQNDGDAALIVFTQGQTWRFTYASELTIVNKVTGLRERKQTDPKRYTYVLGKNRHCRTAVERFSGLKSTTALFNDSKISINEIEKAFSVETLTKQFYKELFDWYQWALSDNDGFAVTFPNDTSIATDDRKIDEHIIRLITRLMFVWFIKQKNLVPDQIFMIGSLKSILKDFDPKSKTNGNYYNAILQNFFFATLNKPIDERAFAEDGDFDNRRKHYGIKTYFRNPKGGSWFKISNKEVINLFSKVPFLNGGLFECLDRSEDSNGKIVYHDGFSREESVKGKLTRAFIPNCLFFDPEKGLIPLLEKYNFTIEESTPIDVEVALDPELLGKVFENLLGAYNPETKETARKQSGSFYTPREIVNYMVDESLIAYLRTKCPEISEESTRFLFNMDNQTFEFNGTERNLIITALKSVRILDPACGSGAFPMGVLNKIVYLLQNLEDEESRTPYEQKLHLIENCIYGIDIQTIAVQISKLRFFISLVSEQVTNSNSEENYGIVPLPNLETKFVAANTLIGLEKDFTDRLDLGFTEIRELKDKLWDIRSKHFSARNASEKESLRKQDEILRKEIQTLLVDLTSKPDTVKIEKLKVEIESLKIEKERYQGENLVELLEPSLIQGKLFNLPAKTEQLTVKIDKNKEDRKRIDKLIKEKQKEIEKEQNKTTHSGFEKEAKQLAKWDPYDQNKSSPYFDSEWMFDVNEGFDIVIGNPPYISAPSMVSSIPEMRKAIIDSNRYTTLYQKWDLYIPFIEFGLQLLKINGVFTMIVPYPVTNQNYALKLRELIIRKYNLIEMVDLNGTRIFENATVSNCIPIIINSKARHDCIISKLDEEKKIRKVFNQNYLDLIQDKGTLVWNLTTEKRGLDRHLTLNVLGDYCYISKGMVLNADENTAKGDFVKDDLISEIYDKVHCKKYIEAKDIERYNVKKIRYLEYNTKRCPDKLSRPTFRELYEKPKLMFNRLGNLMVILDNETRFLHSDSMYSAVLWKDLENVENKSISASVKRYSKLSREQMTILSSTIDLRYLLAVLNSNYASILLTNLRGGDYHIYPEHIRNLPIPNISKNQKSIIKLVDQILYVKKGNPRADTTVWEKQIDAMVYKFYELTFDEVKMIDPDFWLNEEEYEKL